MSGEIKSTMTNATNTETETMTTLNDWLTQQPMDERETALYDYDDYYDEPPDVDDSVRFCPECETPNQFGELCGRCRREIDAEGYDYIDGD